MSATFFPTKAALPCTTICVPSGRVISTVAAPPPLSSGSCRVAIPCPFPSRRRSAPAQAGARGDVSSSGRAAARAAPRLRAPPSAPPLAVSLRTIRPGHEPLASRDNTGDCEEFLARLLRGDNVIRRQGVGSLERATHGRGMTGHVGEHLRSEMVSRRNPANAGAEL